jgi:hypothetical protein
MRLNLRSIIKLAFAIAWLCGALLSNAQVLDAWRITRTNDVSIYHTYDEIAWPAGDTVQYDLWVERNSATLAMPSNCYPVWSVTDATLTNFYIQMTGTIANATNGHISFTLASTNSALDWMLKYHSVVRVYQAASSNIIIRRADRTGVKVLWNPDYAGDIVQPIPNTNVVLNANTIVASYFWALHSNDIWSAISGAEDDPIYRAASNALVADIAARLDSNTWAVADSTTNYVPRTDGTPLYDEVDPVWSAASNDLATDIAARLNSNTWAAADSTTNYVPRTDGTPLYDEVDPVWTNEKASGFTVGGNISLAGNDITQVDRLEIESGQYIEDGGLIGGGDWGLDSGVTLLFPDATLDGGGSGVITNAIIAGYATGTPVYTEIDPLWTDALETGCVFRGDVTLDDSTMTVCAVRSAYFSPLVIEPGVVEASIGATLYLRGGYGDGAGDVIIECLQHAGAGHGNIRLKPGLGGESNGVVSIHGPLIVNSDFVVGLTNATATMPMFNSAGWNGEHNGNGAGLTNLPGIMSNTPLVASYFTLTTETYTASTLSDLDTAQVITNADRVESFCTSYVHRAHQLVPSLLYLTNNDYTISTAATNVTINEDQLRVSFDDTNAAIITLSHGDYARTSTLAPRAVANYTNRYIYTGITGSLRYAMTDGYDDALALTETDVYSIKVHETAYYRRNTNCWAHGLIDLTCASPWNSAFGEFRAGTAITPLHIAYAKHYALQTGTVVRFVDATNVVHEREITDIRYPVDDIAIAQLNSPLPSGIVPAKILTKAITDYLPQPSTADARRNSLGAQIPVAFLNRQEHIYCGQWHNAGDDYAKSEYIYISYLHTNRSARYSVPVGGDSGNPILAKVGTNTALLTCWHTAQFGPSYKYYASALQSAITNMGATQTLNYITYNGIYTQVATNDPPAP